MENILIPTDFSDNARNAMSYAQAYFSDLSVNFYILHASAPEEEDTSLVDPATPSGSRDVTFAPASPKIKLEKEIEYCEQNSQNPSHRFIPVLRNKPFLETIRSYIASNQIDYILMGSHGITNSNTKRIGSNAYKVITKVKCPVIIIPEQAQLMNFKNIAFPTDYNNMDRDRMISILYETLLFKGATLRILEINHPHHPLTLLQKTNQIFLEEFLNNASYSCHYLKNESLVEGIQEQVDTLRIDMIAVVGRNLNFVTRLLFDPKPKTIDYHFKTPFLILHE